MTISQALAYADEARPNAVPTETKLRFLRDVEGAVLVTIHKLTPQEAGEITNTYTKSDGKTLQVPAPFDSLYIHYLASMIGWHMGDTEMQTNDAIMYNKARMDYAKWYIRTNGGTKNG